MKTRFLTTISIILFVNNIFGQDSKILLGINMSPGLANISSNMVDNNYRFGYSGVLRAEYWISKHFSAKIDLGYERKGSRINNIMLADENGDPYGVADLILNYDYIVFPIYGSFRTNGKIRLIVDLGPNLGYLVSQTNKIKSSVAEVDSKSENNAKNLNRFDFGINNCIGVGTTIMDKIDLSFGLRGSIGVSNLAKHPNDNWNRNNTMGFYLGIMYKI